ncbi:MAG: thermonuclease family protein [Planctomycetota bacterium]|jgi:micrococcal nuclease
MKTEKQIAMSKSRRRALFILALLIVVAVIWLDNHRHRTIKTAPAGPAKSTNRDIERYHTKTFTVARVIDGDTLDIDIPDRQYKTTRIRLWGVDTPETEKPQSSAMYFGPEAAEFTGKSALDKAVTIYLNSQKTRGKYGRLLAYVQLPDGSFLNENLLSEGFAYADLRFSHDFYYKYIQLEAAARSRKKGLWQNVTRPQLPEWLQRKKPNLLRKK